MSDNAFIFMLVLGMTVLAGILTVAHVSAYRLRKRLELRRQGPVVAPEMGNVVMPELVDPQDLPGAVTSQSVSVHVRHAEPAR